MINKKLFYRNTVTHNILKPRLVRNEDIVLPFNSIVHHLRIDGNIGPRVEDLPYRSYKGNMYIKHVATMTSLLGRARLDASTYKKRLKDFRTQYPEFKLASGSIDEIKKLQLGIINYNPLLSSYRYPNNPSRNYFIFRNIFNTVMSEIVNTTNDKMDFLYVDVMDDESLRDPATFTRFAKLKSIQARLKITGYFQFFMYEFAMHSMGKISIFSILEEEDLINTFLVFRTSSTSTVINLATLALQLTENTDFLVKEMKESYKVVKQPLLKGIGKSKVIPSLLDSLITELPIDSGKVFDAEDAILDSEERVKNALKTTPISVTRDPIEAAREILDTLSDTDALTTTKYRSLEKRLDESSKLENPFTPDVPISDFVKISTEDTSLESATVPILKDNSLVPNELIETRLKEFDKKYVNDIMQKHQMSMIHHIQSSGALITSMEVEDTGSVLGEFTSIKIRFSPMDGTPSVVYIKVPKVSEEGTFMSNGTVYRMKKQHSDLPIRKIKPYEVALSSYYGKIFVKRSNLAVNSMEKWFARVINKASSTKDAGIDTVNENLFKGSIKAPYHYGVLSMNFRRITKGKVIMDFDYDKRDQWRQGHTLSLLESKGRVLIGTSGKTPLLMGKDNLLYLWKEGEPVYFDTVFGLLGLNESKAPVPVATIRLLGKEFPILWVLAHIIGLSSVIQHLGVKYKFIKRNKRYKEPHVMQVKFADVTLIIEKASDEAILLLQGLVKNKGSVALLDYKDFDKAGRKSPEGVESVLLDMGLPSRFIVEIGLLNTLFIDPITKTVLEEMKEPTVFTTLLFRSVELLGELYHPEVTDSDFMRERGYERMSGAIYGELVRATRAYKTAINPRKRAIDMSHFGVWNAILQDSTSKPTEDSNPLAALKEQEIITYLGAGGRSKDTLSAPTRIFHENDDGILSEAVPDSGTVGVNAYLSANPNIVNTLGMHGKREGKPDSSQRFSTNYLNTPMLDTDNPMRAVMSHIQQSHVVSINKAEPAMVRTGMEYVIPHRVGKLYSNMASKGGKVLEVDDHGIKVEYADKSTAWAPLGTSEGYAEGKVYGHTLVTHLKKGDKFEEGQALSFNKDFFEVDKVDPRQLVYKQGTYVTTAFIEGPLVHEDSCILWRGLGERLGTSSVKKKTYTLGFKDDVRNMVKTGDKVLPGDTLFLIEDEITVGSGAFDEDSVNTLQDLTRQAPRSDSGGTITKIEVLYNGSISDMSPGLAKLARASDKAMKIKSASRGENAYTGNTFGELRIEGKVLALDEVAINIFTTSDKGVFIGDKFVFASQLKATVGSMLVDPIKTASGREVHAGFSYKAAKARMASSAITVPIAVSILKYLPNYLLRKYS